MSAAAMDPLWAFTDVNAVSWAQANRAAERYCATRGQGFQGGHFSFAITNIAQFRFDIITLYIHYYNIKMMQAVHLT